MLVTLQPIMRFVLTILMLAVALCAAAQREDDPQYSDFEEIFIDTEEFTPPPGVDPLPILPDSAEQVRNDRSATAWIGQLIRNGFRINDPGINYPRFPNFLRKVYNWGDRTFNHYDSTYVVATGRNWKIQGKSFNWMENYAAIFERNKEMLIRSDIYADVGAYLSFMAVSVGYMFNANEILGHNRNYRTHFNFNFTCALFNVDYLDTSTKGGAVIWRLSDYKNGHMVHIPFDAISHHTRSLTGTYFFNHRKYSHAAAYCYSKYQLRRAASWMIGFYCTTQNISMNFDELSEAQLAVIPEAYRHFRMHYNDYAINVGYGINCVLKPRAWLFNFTFLQGFGHKHTREDSTDGRRDMIALNPQAMFSFVYNHRALFTSLQGKFDGNFYFNRHYTFFNAMSTLQLTVGARF